MIILTICHSFQPFISLVFYNRLDIFTLVNIDESVQSFQPFHPSFLIFYYGKHSWNHPIFSALFIPCFWFTVVNILEIIQFLIYNGDHPWKHPIISALVSVVSYRRRLEALVGVLRGRLRRPIISTSFILCFWSTMVKVSNNFSPSIGCILSP